MNVLQIICKSLLLLVFVFSSRRRHTRLQGDWSSDVCSSDLSRHASTIPCGAVSFHRPRVKSGALIGLLPLATDHSLSGPKIGRASCREGVEILEDASL